jgi:hypothetical protein
MKYKTCIVCGNEYRLNPKYSLNQKIKSKYCSNKCNGIDKRKNDEKVCIVCGKKFRVYGKIIKDTAKWCSHKCQRKEFSIDKNTGYIRKNGKIHTAQHRLVMEEHLGIKLKRTDIVHHLNNNKTDNRIENLKLMSMKEHMLLHKNLPNLR